MKKLFASLALSSTLMLATACNTVRGAADDVESVGDCADSTENNG